MTYARKVDANQAVIVKALRRAGCFVEDTSRLGNGSPDLNVARAGVWHRIEVKKPGGTLTGDQKDFIADLDGRAPIHVVENEEQALAAVGVLRRTA